VDQLFDDFKGVPEALGGGVDYPAEGYEAEGQADCFHYATGGGLGCGSAGNGTLDKCGWILRAAGSLDKLSDMLRVLHTFAARLPLWNVGAAMQAPPNKCLIAGGPRSPIIILTYLDSSTASNSLTTGIPISCRVPLK
jgi:hypothetical protein